MAPPDPTTRITVAIQIPRPPAGGRKTAEIAEQIQQRLERE